MTAAERRKSRKAGAEKTGTTEVQTPQAAEEQLADNISGRLADKLGTSVNRLAEILESGQFPAIQMGRAGVGRSQICGRHNTYMHGGRCKRCEWEASPKRKVKIDPKTGLREDHGQVHMKDTVDDMPEAEVRKGTSPNVEEV